MNTSPARLSTIMPAQGRYGSDFCEGMETPSLEREFSRPMTLRWLRLDRHHCYRHKEYAARLDFLRPVGDPRNGRWLRGGKADCDPAIPRSHFKTRKRSVDFSGSGNRIEDDIGLYERQIVAAGKLTGRTSRR